MKGNGQSAANINFIMKKEILFSYTQLLERIKYYYEYTSYSICQFSEILGITRCKAEKLIKQYKFKRDIELDHLSRSYSTKDIWAKRNKEERHNIATKGNTKRKNTWKNKPDDYMQQFKEQHRRISNELCEKLTDEDRLEISQRTKNYWNNLDEEALQDILNKKHNTWANKSDEEKIAFASLTSQRNKIYWSNFDNKRKTSNNISLAWKNKSIEEQNSIKEKISESQKERVSKRTTEQKLLESERKSIAGKEVWKNYSEEEYTNICKQRSVSVTKVWDDRTEDERQQIFNKMYETQIKNNSFGKSSLEYYILGVLNKKFNIEHQYKLDTKWFDFAITYNNELTLLELNGKFWHNNRPFNGSEEHIKEYNELVKLGGRKEAIANTWRYRDTAKLNFCRERKLNFIVIYCGRKSKNLDAYLNNIENYLNKGMVIKIL